ncbi:Zn-dependent protease with chaperone function [Nonomuraea jabiensis]|uniref:Zn-dependent protease with chaperone function n=1 Tax=Nonomuraea jabiensis TaxID=882448 RepID=A0A7W9LFG6_9ACTN|nr:Zn-dependent protease with chaperone function [Nonomuraea jabiensis]
MAFCAGMLRPRVYVSAGLVDKLSDDELRAVLCHEAAHARRRDPLRRVLLDAATDVLFFLPLLRWAARVQKERAELSADRAAIAQVGARHVEGALLAMDGHAAPAGVAAFDGAAAARVAQLVGDAPPSHKAGLGLVGLSLTGLVAATSLMMCVGQGLWMFVTTSGM